MHLIKGKKSFIFLLIFILSLAVVTVGIVFFVRTFCLYTVSFDTDCDMSVESYRVIRGFAGHDPKAKLRKVGYYFIEWCEDKECTKPYDFNTPVVDDVTLYAHWGDASAVLLKYADGEGEEYLTQQQLDDYVEYVKPGTSSTVDIYTNELGYTLVWFEDADMSGKYYTEPTTFNLGNSNKTLYGAWCDISESSYDTVNVQYCGICGEKSASGINNGRCTSCNSPVYEAKYIDKYKGTCRNVIIPSKIGGLRVKGSTHKGEDKGDGAFYKSRSYLKKVILPDGFEMIGDYTFAYCEKLHFFIMGDDVTHVGHSAFASCLKLKNVKFSNNIEYFGDYAFFETILQRVTIPDSCKYVGDATFNGTPITSIDIPGSVKTIGMDAFNNCIQLAQVRLGDGIESIGASAFANTIITQIHIPRSVRVLGNSDNVVDEQVMAGTVFNFNSNLATVTIDENNPYFKVVDNVIYSADMSTLYFCPRAKHIDGGTWSVADSVSKIMPYAMSGLRELVHLTLSKNVVYIGNNAFIDNDALKDVIIKKPSDSLETEKQLSIYGRAFFSCEVLEKVHLERVILLGDGVFHSCGALVEMVLPNGVALHNSVFHGCKLLDKVVFLGIVILAQPSYSELFASTDADLELYIPSEDMYVDYFGGVFSREDFKKYYDEGAVVYYENISDCNLHFYNVSDGV